MEDAIRVFLVDNSQDLLCLLRAALEERGAVVIGTASDGAAALHALRTLRPDVLLTELLLPALDGIAMLRQLREEGCMPHTIILSAFWNDRVARISGQLGVELYLPKPCAVDTLWNAVRELGASGLRQDPERGSRVRELLLRFPVPAHLSGHLYLCAGLELVSRDRSCLQGVTKSLYRDLARQFGTTGACVERSMRAAIAAGWAEGTAEQRRRAFGGAFDRFDRPPPITRFLSIMAEQLALRSADRTLDLRD